MKNFMTMLLAPAQKNDRNTDGVGVSVLHSAFTPVELLGVVTMITILAAIGLI